MDGSLAVFHGPRPLADYDEKGKEEKQKGSVSPPLAGKERGSGLYLSALSLKHREKRTYHVLQNRTFLFAANTGSLIITK